MAATMATMAILNPNCIKSAKLSNSKPTAQPKPISLIPTIQNGLVSASTPIKAGAVAGAFAGAFFAGLSSCEPAMAAQQLAQIADGSDNRGLALLLPLVPAIGWVLYNILQPALNQINRMRNQKALIVGLGLELGGLLWAGAPGSAEAAVAEAAGSDNRGTLLLIVILPAIGWVLFNILQPALNQLNRMRSE